MSGGTRTHYQNRVKKDLCVCNNAWTMKEREKNNCNECGKQLYVRKIGNSDFKASEEASKLNLADVSLDEQSETAVCLNCESKLDEHEHEMCDACQRLSCM